MKFRHEYKLSVTMAEYYEIRSRLRVLCQMDSHASANGRYFVRSLYFDNADDLALHEKLDGVRCREKFRLRFYNGDLSYIRLEKKSKLNGLSYKQGCLVTMEQVEDLLTGRRFWTNTNDSLSLELGIKMTTMGLRPKTLVDYEREAYVYTTGNIRMNFDFGIRSGLYSVGFLDTTTPTVQATDLIVFEVKYDEYLPIHLRDAIQTGGSRAQAFSKYAACRVFG